MARVWPLAVALGGWLLVTPLAFAAPSESHSTAYTPRQSDRPEPLPGEEPGFQSIFNGRTLEGWQGDERYWRVEDGALVGEITPATLLQSNTFIVWQGGQPADFELKLEYRITPDGNSGINYRSVIVDDPVTPGNRFVLRGYQCDLDGRNRYTGNNYEEKGRLFLALRGQVTRVVGGRPPILLTTPTPEPVGEFTDGWNRVHLIVRGHTLVHLINDRLMTVVIDDDATHRPHRGVIGVQVHVGPPMKVEFRHLRLKTYDPATH